MEFFAGHARDLHTVSAQLGRLIHSGSSSLVARTARGFFAESLAVAVVHHIILWYHIYDTTTTIDEETLLLELGDKSPGVMHPAT
jgi:hypothetical protein